MGWLIRFIHNRDLAVENIVTAYVRQRLVLTAPVEALSTLDERLDHIGVKLPVRSLLLSVNRILDLKGAMSGDFAVEVRRNKRKEISGNFRKFPGDSSVCAAQIQTLAMKLKLSTPRWNLAVVHEGAFIRLNGRPYRRGDYVEYVNPIPRFRSSNAGADSWRAVGKLLQFYLVPCRNNELVTFVSVDTLIARISTATGMHDVDRGAPEDQDQPPSTLLHVDSIAYKLHRVPHPSKPEESFCCLRIWEAR